MNHVQIEVCVDRADVAVAAGRAGADRFEVNNRLDLDGLTPDDDLVRECIATKVPVIAMARPDTANNRFEREGFVYSQPDWDRLIGDAARMVRIGVAGVAAGCLHADGSVDRDRVMQLRKICGDREFVFHRAFDLCSDWAPALEILVDCGVDRILTSGLAATAVQGADLLARLIEDGRIEILPAAGITSSNAMRLIEVTGASQIHGSFSKSASTGKPGGAEVVFAGVSELKRLLAG